MPIQSSPEKNILIKLLIKYIRSILDILRARTNTVDRFEKFWYPWLWSVEHFDIPAEVESSDSLASMKIQIKSGVVK